MFAKSTKQLTLDEERELTYKRAKRLIEYDLMPDSQVMSNPEAAVAYQDALCSYDPVLLQVIALSVQVSAIDNLMEGTKYKYSNVLFVCFECCFPLLVFSFWERLFWSTNFHN